MQHQKSAPRAYHDEGLSASQVEVLHAGGRRIPTFRALGIVEVGIAMAAKDAARFLCIYPASNLLKTRSAVAECRKLPESEPDVFVFGEALLRGVWKPLAFFGGLL